MELEQVGNYTYYIKNATNIGIYQVNEKEVYVIDTGNDADAGKKILKIITEQGWTIKGIINTHSHADHIGGNKLLQDRTNANIYAPKIETQFIETPILEPSMLYSAYPFHELQNKFLCAKNSCVKDIDAIKEEGLTCIFLKGHSYEMIGVHTSDDVYFLADALFSPQTIQKYHLFYIYNVKEFLNTLDNLENLKGKIYILSHVEKQTDIADLIQLNRNKVEEISNIIYEICKQEKTWEEIVKEVFNRYQLTMNLNQYYLVGSTIRAYLTYLKENQKIDYTFVDNKMVWKQIKNP